MVSKVLQLIIVLVWMTHSVHSCSCAGVKHPQDKFCKAGHVFYGKVIKEKLIPGPANDVNNNDAIWEYTFKIIFKMKGVSEGVGQNIVIETAGNGALCGVRFNVGKSYILMGAKKPDGTKTIASCDFISQLSNLSPYQSFYLFTRGSYSYRRNCKKRCKISPDSKDCKYDPFNTNDGTICLAKKALCRREGWQCRWVNNGTC
ncbi:metalloproteinase inhibitor 4-like [Mytilus californianus]|uniref:metalloproteinase inhibitor 4-like n=1 Tax=Mytilus californianus TaxID=6549 RepID=UPI002247D2B6|nr:metalloproteinase inhibitor 4-like [Mytilus californianus]